MNYIEATKHLHALRGAGMIFGLRRLARALELCGNRHMKTPYIHIAGTNGKGSTARMLQCILTAAGYRTGLFMSPAPDCPRDMITADGTAISEDTFAALITELAEVSAACGGLTEFEMMTAAALLYFSDLGVSAAVVECGLGGRDDATNVIPAPLAAVITPVSLDHTQVLGTTVTAIARHKCGIIKPPCAVVCAPEQNSDALGVIMETAALYGLAVHMPSSSAAPITQRGTGLMRFNYNGADYTLPLTGDFQRDNALTALETIRTLSSSGLIVTAAQAAEGLSRVVMPCRQELLNIDPLIIVDGAHNPHGLERLAETLRRLAPSGGVTLIAGMLADKDTRRCMELLTPFCAQVICCSPDSPRAMPGSTLAAIAKQVAPELRVSVCDTPVQALSLWDGQSPLVAGCSFYTAGAVRQALAGQ